MEKVKLNAYFFEILTSRIKPNLARINNPAMDYNRLSFFKYTYSSGRH